MYFRFNEVSYFSAEDSLDLKTGLEQQLYLNGSGYLRKLAKHRKFCLAETGCQPTFHKVYIVATGAELICCLAKKFAGSIFCLTA